MLRTINPLTSGLPCGTSTKLPCSLILRNARISFLFSAQIFTLCGVTNPFSPLVRASLFRVRLLVRFVTVTASIPVPPQTLRPCAHTEGVFLTSKRDFILFLLKTNTVVSNLRRIQYLKVLGSFIATALFFFVKKRLLTLTTSLPMLSSPLSLSSLVSS